MNDTLKEYRIDRALAEQALAQHLASLGGQSHANHSFIRSAVRRFLADLCQTCAESTAGYLVLSEARLFSWLIGEARRRSTIKARQSLAVVSRYVRELVRADLLGSDVMAAFKARYGNRGWKTLVPALQAPDAEAALALLRVETPASGPITSHVQRYVDLHQALGKDYGQNQSILMRLDRFLQAQGILSPQAILPDVIERWADTLTGNARTHMQKARLAWRFFKHLLELKVVSHNPVSPVTLGLDRRPNQLFKPFIFATEQVAAILETARQLPGNHCFPLRGPTCSTILALLYALGLRIGEACRLRVRDLSVSEATLFITQTKFYKSRYVPFGLRLGQCLEQYLDCRRQRQPTLGEETPLFVALGPGPVNKCVLQEVFRAILEGLGIRGLPGQKAPRLHDLRHTFAVHRLLRWYREGVDVQSKLPALSTFLGHINPQSTQIYLTITTALLQEASSRFHRNFGHFFDLESNL